MMKRQYLNVFAKQQQNIKKYLSRLAPLAFSIYYYTVWSLSENSARRLSYI